MKKNRKFVTLPAVGSPSWQMGKMRACARKSGVVLVALGMILLLRTPLGADTITYADRPTFMGQLNSFVLDDYSNPGYDLNGPVAFDVHSNAYMSSVLGETQYTTTGLSNTNLIFNQSIEARYCAGCNRSFRLDFTATSVSGTNGVFGAGVDFHNGASPPYFAFVTFGDGSTGNFALPVAAFVAAGDLPTFWGITSDLEIATIHFGLSGGGSTASGSFVIDNLTVGSPVPVQNEVPEPSTMLLVGTGIAGYIARRRKAARSR